MKKISLFRFTCLNILFIFLLFTYKAYSFQRVTVDGFKEFKFNQSVDNSEKLLNNYCIPKTEGKIEKYLSLSCDRFSFLGQEVSLILSFDSNKLYRIELKTKINGNELKKKIWKYYTREYGPAIKYRSTGPSFPTYGFAKNLSLYDLYSDIQEEMNNNSSANIDLWIVYSQ